MAIRIRQLLIWFLLFYLTFDFFGDVARKNSWEPLGDLFRYPDFVFILTTLMAFWVFTLGAYLILYQLYAKRTLLIVIPLLVLNVLAAIVFRYLLQEVLTLYFLGFRNYFVEVSASYYFIDNLYYGVTYTALGVIFYFVQFARFKETQRQELILQNQQTELAFLRSQINPHFLFNTLNNVYTLVYRKSEHALSAIERLTQLLRYSLYEKAERVPLDKELHFIDNFMELQRLRYDFEPNIKMDIRIPQKELLIAPNLLIPFVENACKHGDLQRLEQPLEIQLWTDSHWLQFKVINAVKRRQKDQTGGIGLGNVRRRLDLLYGEKADLQVQAGSDLFAIHLKIALEVC